MKCRLQAVDFQLNACRDARPVRPLTFQLTVDEYTGEQVDCCVACRDARLVRPPPITLHICFQFSLNGRTDRASLHAVMAKLMRKMGKISWQDC